MTDRSGLRRLRLFLGVADLGSFSACARAFGITQPALSRTVMQLEEELGARLFDRTTRAVTLTPSGVRFQETARGLVRDFDARLAEAKVYLSGGSGVITVGALASVAAISLPTMIAEFRAAHPKVGFRVLDALSAEIVRSVMDGRADLGLSSRPEPVPGLEYQELVTDPFGLICRRDDPLAEAKSVRWADFVERPFVAMAPGSGVRAGTDAAFVQIMAPVKPLFECTYLSSAAALVAAGLGVSAIPRMATPLLGRSDLVWKPLVSPELGRSIGLLTRSDRTLAPAAAAFAQHVLERQRQDSRYLDGGEAASQTFGWIAT